MNVVGSGKLFRPRETRRGEFRGIDSPPSGRGSGVVLRVAGEPAGDSPPLAEGLGLSCGLQANLQGILPPLAEGLGCPVGCRRTCRGFPPSGRGSGLSCGLQANLQGILPPGRGSGLSCGLQANLQGVLPLWQRSGFVLRVAGEPAGDSPPLAEGLGCPAGCRRTCRGFSPSGKGVWGLCPQLPMGGRVGKPAVYWRRMRSCRAGTTTASSWVRDSACSRSATALAAWPSAA